MHALLSLLLAASPALTAAQKHLAGGKLDELAFDLGDAVKLAPAEVPEAARLLAEGGEKAQKAGDAVLALQLGQQAHRRDPKNAAALRLLAGLALADQTFTEAEAYADALLNLDPADARAALLRARIADAEGDYARAAELAGPLAKSDKLAEPERAEAARIRKGAQAALDARAAEEAPHREAEERLRVAAERARAERERAFTQEEAAPAPTGEIVLYGTSWCGFCAKARAYFKSKGLAFEDKDVEKDQAAAEELAAKAEQQGFSPKGVPVIDVRGTLVQGFDKSRIDWLLEQQAH